MILSEDQREAIKASLEILKVKQAEIAKSLELAPSALSDMLRPSGARSFPDSKLAELIPNLTSRLRAKRESASRPLQRMIDQCLSDIGDIRDLSVGLGLDSVTPGSPIPYNRQIGFVHPIASNLAGKLARPIGWVHHFAGPKTGVTSAYNHAVDRLKEDGRAISFVEQPPNLDEFETPERASSALIIRLHDYIVGASDNHRQLDGLTGRELQRQFISNVGNWLSSLPPPPSRKVKAVVVFDGMDRWLTAATVARLPKLYDLWLSEMTPLFAEIRKRYFNDLSIVSACSPVALSALMARRTNLSEFLMGSEFSDFVNIDYLDFCEIGESCGVEYSDDFKRWHEYYSGSIFLSHLFFFLLKREKNEWEIEEFIRDCLSDREPKPLGFPEERSIRRSLHDFRVSIIASWEIYRINLPDTIGAITNFKDVFGFINDIDLDGKFQIPAELTSSPALDWAFGCSLLSRSQLGSVGAMQPLFEALVSYEIENSEGAK